MHTDLIEVKELFDKIANTSGKNDKIKIIKQNKDNELFVECLKFLLDSDIVTGLSKKKIGKKVKLDKETTSDIRCIFDYLNQILSNLNYLLLYIDFDSFLFLKMK